MKRNVVIVEIRAAEGGADARLLVVEQFAIYTRVAARKIRGALLRRFDVSAGQKSQRYHVAPERRVIRDEEKLDGCLSHCVVIGQCFGCS